VTEFRLMFRTHAIRRMVQRGVTPGDVRDVVERGEVIEAYPDDVPRPSRLVLGQVRGRPLHVVVSDEPQSGSLVVVTVYEPEPASWTHGFRRRR
jgi:hypothetical protein